MRALLVFMTVVFVGVGVLMFGELARATVVAVNGSPITVTAVPTPLPPPTEPFQAGVGRTLERVTSDTFSLEVVEQPVGQPTFVSDRNGVLTHFGMPDAFGVTALLAHNYLSGEDISHLEVGDTFMVVYHDGYASPYRVVGIERYQALTPTSPYSDFVPITGGDVISSAQLFEHVYTVWGRLVFQTCIRQGDDWAWGRLFIFAERIQ